MSLLIAELFERHDRGRFEVFGYCASPEDGSDTRQRVIAAFNNFTRIAHLSDEQAARAIRADEIDILIDLNGLPSGARLQVLRWRSGTRAGHVSRFYRASTAPRARLYVLRPGCRPACDRIGIPPDAALHGRVLSGE
jgi:hypothetical protein